VKLSIFLQDCPAGHALPPHPPLAVMLHASTSATPNIEIATVVNTATVVARNGVIAPSQVKFACPLGGRA
jgi:hypothetical protein